jgi:CheY-like chemotaxis protein
VIVADYAMPVMNGFEMLKQLKQAADTKNIPVVMITGEDSKANSEAMVLTGASAIFSKPVVPEKLEAELRKILAPFLQS